MATITTKKVNRGKSLGSIKSTVNRAFALSFATRLPMVELDFNALKIATDKCLYCGDPMTCWDHFDNITERGRWSQQLEALVPACDPCNEKGKRNRHPEVYAAELDKQGRGKDGLLRTAPERVDVVRKALPKATDLGAAVCTRIEDYYARYDQLWVQMTKLDAEVKEWVQEDLVPTFKAKLIPTESL